MAIKFVDIEPEDEPAPKQAPPPEKPAKAVQLDPPGSAPDGQLPFVKSEPEPPGREKPMR